MPGIANEVSFAEDKLTQTQTFASRKDAEAWEYMVRHTIDELHPLIPDFAVFAANLADCVREHGSDIVRFSWYDAKEVSREDWKAGKVVPPLNAGHLADLMDGL